MARKPKKTAQPATIQRILNLVPSEKTEGDWTYDVALAAGALRAAPLPPEVDLRETWWKVGDQGNTGSCVGWATADGIMRYLLTKAGRLNEQEQLSVRFVWMASKETDEFTDRPQTFIEEAGTSLKNAADICRKYGVPLAADLPFTIETTMFPGREQTFYARAAQRKASSYFNVRKNLNNWKRSLADGTPLLVGLTVDAGFMAAPTTGLLDSYDPGSATGGHAVCIVGYRTDGRFILRNSWDTTWGHKGFAYLSPAYIEAAFFDEAYALVL